MVRQHHRRASNPTIHTKDRLHLHCSRFRQKEEDMTREEIDKIMENELDNQPMASDRVKKAYSALDDAVEEYTCATQEDAFYFGFLTAMKFFNVQEG